MEKTVARQISNMFCGLGILFIFFLLYYIVANPISSPSTASISLAALFAGLVTWKLDDWREAPFMIYICTIAEGLNVCKTDSFCSYGERGEENETD